MIKKIISLLIISLFFLTQIAIANPVCDRCNYEMVEIKVDIGNLYVCRNCAGDVIITVTVEDEGSDVR